jgi:hypothetical protein
MTKLSPMQELLRRTMSQTPPMQPDDRLTVDPTPPQGSTRDSAMFESPEEADAVLSEAKERQARQSQPSSNTATGETPTK